MSASLSLRSAITKGISDLGLAPEADIAPQLEQYVHGLVKWNTAYNLTAIRDPQQMVALHLLDSLAVVPYIDAAAALDAVTPDLTPNLTAELSQDRQSGQILDVGSGAGLPGIPLALYYPQIRFVLLDSNGKKTRFLQQMQIELGLVNVTVVQARVEAHKGLYKQVICRAFANLADIASASQHLLAAGGSLLAMKGKREAAHLGTTVLRVAKVIPLDVPGIAAERHLYVLHRHDNHTKGA
ncbi:MAG: 16S rRNA (guanine(527)-N(7))-methyltransferase RsmG [Pseudomonadales bacterium]|jgi:16S rRNA (guanine527-N7)-methyltransferase|nr:16S rRNA (guanine(527)-N(7))-methyltransferase RsmG [Pseudomonadales bacterium]MDP4640879.1 16S rRNA (guanine(527)-N(7))-methyltransferase RsmG [Pseudomonadales bacterium]MDP4874573.1 16S rRNA (guanine(527)-N(7))-methyltransferase RsmG [Pseudomonadales bacterium]MDP4911454.1 16S rRNA (guanine(527)-N(7))-methyltransferase RsmG [Pseudomonadales bacterium]MDP5058834.1 16S rRNA (guanine(527)-N(7))-methyltransferase RsmG [Pseudomonadales bacterium]